MKHFVSERPTAYRKSFSMILHNYSKKVIQITVSLDQIIKWPLKKCHQITLRMLLYLWSMMCPGVESIHSFVCTNLSIAGFCFAFLQTTHSMFDGRVGIPKFSKISLSCWITTKGHDYNFYFLTTMNSLLNQKKRNSSKNKNYDHYHFWTIVESNINTFCFETGIFHSCSTNDGLSLEE